MGEKVAIFYNELLGFHSDKIGEEIRLALKDVPYTDLITRQYREPLLHEFETMELVRDYARRNPEAKILYMNNKGVTAPEVSPKHTHRRLLIKHMLIGWHKVFDLLRREYDIVGTKIRKDPAPHFPSSWCWAKAEYINKLSSLNRIDRYSVEFYLFSGNPTYRELIPELSARPDAELNSERV